MSSVLLGAALSSVIVAVITQMICSTVTSSQRCHLKLKIHVKSGDATFKQTVETWSDFTINVLLNSFMPLWLHMGDGRFQGSGHLEDVCVNLFGLLLQNTTHWEADRTEIYFRTILVAISPRSSCQQGFFFFFSWGLSPWLVDGCLLPEFSRGYPSVCVGVQISSFYKDPVILD